MELSNKQKSFLKLVETNIQLKPTFLARDIITDKKDLFVVLKSEQTFHSQNYEVKKINSDGNLNDVIFSFNDTETQYSFYGCISVRQLEALQMLKIVVYND